MFSLRSLLLVQCSILALLLPPSADAAVGKKKNAAKIGVDQILQQVALTDSAGKPFVCAKLADGTWWAGEIKRSKFVIFKREIPLYKAKSASANTDTKVKKWKAAIKRAKKTQRQCVTEGPQDSHGLPVANAAVVAGVGVAPVAITMSGNSGKEGDGYTCKLVTAPSNGSVTEFSEENCNALITPADHRSGNVLLQFAVRRVSDGVQSAPATITVNYDQSGAFSGDYHSLARYKSSLTELEAAKLARWFGLGKDMDAMIEIGTGTDGLDNLIDALTAQNSSSACAAIETQAAALAQAYYQAWGMSLASTPGGSSAWYTTANLYWSQESFQMYMLHMLRYGCEPAREHLALMLMNHFPVNLQFFNWGNSRDAYIPDYLDMLRSRGAHNQGKLVNSLQYTMSLQHGRSGAMLVYLNNRYNYRNGNQFGNEDYARELMELFALGPKDAVTDQENYNEDNVFQLGFAVMGYTEETDPDGRGNPTISCSYHSIYNPHCGANGLPTVMTTPSPKTVPTFDDLRWNNPQNPDPSFLFQQFPFGQYAVFKANTFDVGEDTVTPYLMNQHPGVPRYLAGRFFNWFAGLELTEEILAPLAAQLKGDGYEVMNVLNDVLGSSANFSPEAVADCVADPVQVIVSMLRGLNLPLARVQAPGVTWYYDLYWRVRELFNTGGFAIGRPDNIFGWRTCGKRTGTKVHDGSVFLAAQPLLERQRQFTWYLNDLNAMINAVPGSIGNFKWVDLLPSNPTLQRDPGAIVDSFSLRLALGLTPAEREHLITYLQTLVFTTKVENGVTVPDNTLVVDWAELSDTHFTQIVRLKIPGLLEILQQLAANNLR